MRGWIHTALVALLVAACSSEAPQSSAAQASKPRKDAAGINACSLLTKEDIQGAAGWRPETTDSATHGRTATCNYHRADGAKVQSVVLIVSPGMRVLKSSAEMAEWRTQAAARHPEMRLVYQPVEGLGVPAISGQSEDDSVPTLEASAKGLLVAVRSSNLDISKALAAKAIARLP
jgi:Protein of unknown function (DUF3558)